MAEMVTGALPEYGRPPVAEVALAIAFDELAGFSAAHLGLLWDRFRGKYPRVEDHPPLEFQMEQVPGSEPVQPRMPSLDMLTKPRIRCWFLTSEGGQLIQAQSDGFVHNWRKQGSQDAQYPRYASVRESFLRELLTFRDFIAEHGLGHIAPRLAELTYVNHLRTSGGGSPHAAIDSFVTFLRPLEMPSFLPPAEDGRIAMRFPIIVNGDFLGRLTVSVQPAYVIQSKEPVLNLTLVAKGRPRERTIEGVLEFLDLGHEWIVRAFTEITTPQMHQTWGRMR
jgi:uncharacterized protein (TIGR04255 family)